MKFNFDPKIEMTEQEIKTLGTFFRAINDACSNTTKCETCILHNLCDEYEDAPFYLSKLFQILGIL